MSVRQYIGARYVPLIMGTYEDGRTYEPLSVVTYLGASYTSKKTTPAGILPTNTEYWVCTGNYNAQVEEYRQSVVNYQKEVDRLKENTGKRNIIFIGDSYGEGDNSWIYYANLTLGRNVGVSYKNARGGAGFLGADYTTSSQRYYSFLELLQELEVSVPDKNNITDIVVCGGYNDYSAGHTYISNLQTRIIEFVSYCYSTYPKAEVYIGMIGSTKNVTVLKGLREETFLYYYSSALNANATYLTGVELSLYSDSFFNADGFHPNQLGSANIGQNVAQILKGANIERYNNLAGSLITEDATSNNVTARFELRTKEMYITSNGGTIVFDGTKSLKASQSGVLKLGTFDGIDCIHAFRDIYSNSRVILSDGTNFSVLSAMLYFEDNVLKAQISDVEESKWKTIQYTTIILSPFTIEIGMHDC